MVRNGPAQSFHRRAGLAALLVWMSHTAAFAQTKPLIAVAPFSSAEGVPAGAASRFTQQISQQLQVRNEVRIASDPKAPVRSVDRAAALLAEGGKAMDELRFPAAVDALRTGIELSFADPSKVDFKMVLDAHAQLAAAALRLGEDKVAQNTLVALAKLDPAYTLGDKYHRFSCANGTKPKRGSQRFPATR
ncbi:MAG: hypothetical protein ACT4TC_26340 [Myxococcaceae bacterium]